MLERAKRFIFHRAEKPTFKVKKTVKKNATPFVILQQALNDRIKHGRVLWDSANGTYCREKHGELK